MVAKENWLIGISHHVFSLLVIFNLVFLNFWIWKYNSQNSDNLLNNNVRTSEDISVVQPEDICDSSCVSKIYDSIYQATASAQVTTIQQSIQSDTQINKEFFIPLGSGTNATDDWSDILGAQVHIDTAKYNSIKNVFFEATVHTPTGNQTSYVRLYNVTDKHPVWFSEVSLDGGKPALLISRPITLDNGNKLYQVQMKTQLKYQSNLLQARVRITTN